MKRGTLLNRHLSRLVASLGHLDEVVVADAGLPAPRGVRVIDLAVSPGVPGFFEVLAALRSELAIEAAFAAKEAEETFAMRVRAELEDWGAEVGRPIALSHMAHEAFKDRTAGARAIVRTGECTPYANLILVSGVTF